MLDCGDQAIQADTLYLFEHLDLAPHYIDLFINATETQPTDNGSSCILSVTQPLYDEYNRTIGFIGKNSGHELYWNTMEWHIFVRIDLDFRNMW